jgi:cell fate (sporulation/competence/biofilm development) regulator YmcA (YheA/YmcA/DUF963 family)
MKQEGIAEVDAVAMTSDLDRLSGYKVADKINEQYKKLCSVVSNLQALQEQDPQYDNIEKLRIMQALAIPFYDQASAISTWINPQQTAFECYKLFHLFN